MVKKFKIAKNWYFKTAVKKVHRIRYIEMSWCRLVLYFKILYCQFVALLTSIATIQPARKIGLCSSNIMHAILCHNNAYRASIAVKSIIEKNEKFDAWCCSATPSNTAPKPRKYSHVITWIHADDYLTSYFEPCGRSAALRGYIWIMIIFTYISLFDGL